MHVAGRSCHVQCRRCRRRSNRRPAKDIKCRSSILRGSRGRSALAYYLAGTHRKHTNEADGETRVKFFDR